MNDSVNNKVMVSIKCIQSFHIGEDARQKIKELIKINGTSQRKLAQESNGAISYAFIGKLLSGQQEGISKNKFLILCDLLNATPEQILSPSIKIFD